MEIPNPHCVSKPAIWLSQLHRLLLVYFAFESLWCSVNVSIYISLCSSYSHANYLKHNEDYAQGDLKIRLRYGS